MNDLYVPVSALALFFKTTKLITMPNEPINIVEYNNNYISTGLTKREYFAAMAMKGILANKSARKKTTEMIIESAVRLSDALIDELNKTK